MQMVIRIDSYPISSGLVPLSITTQIVNSEPITLLVRLVSRTELLPTAKDFIEAENLLPEIVSRAGLVEETAFSSIVELSHTAALDGTHLYQMQLSVENS
jgi:hypothetical protein